MLTIKDIQTAELEIYKYCSDICERNNITYYISFGSALGAVRHKGFIPWDDDIDVMIPYDEMAKFKECFLREAPKNLFYEDMASEKLCGFTWAKIRNTNTCSMPTALKHIPINWGICIDIFPMYNIDKNGMNKALKRFNLANGVLYSLFSKHDNNATFVKKLLAALPTCFRRTIAKLAMKPLENHMHTGYYFDGWNLLDSSMLGEKPLYVDFEDISVPIPYEYDNYLTTLYGDYMQLPPENERGGHELAMGDIVWSITESYKNFL